MKTIVLVLVVFFLLADLAYSKSGVSLGGMVGISSRLLYKRGSKNSIRELPFLTIQLGAFSIQGAEIRYTPIRNPAFTFSLMANFISGPPLDGIGGDIGQKPIDNKYMEVGYQGINDRDHLMNAGLSISMYGPLKLKYALETRFSEQGGYSIFKISKPFVWVSGRFIFTPYISATMLYSKYCDYYFGVSTDEANNLESYKIEAAYEIKDTGWVRNIGVANILRLSPSLTLLILGKLQNVVNTIKKSPLVKRSTVLSGAVGIKYNF